MPATKPSAKPSAPKTTTTAGIKKPKSTTNPAGAPPKKAKPVKAAVPAAVEKPSAPKTPVAKPTKPKTAAPKAKKPVKSKSKLQKKKKQAYKFTIECKNPVDDGIMKTNAFEDFLKERIKFKGKTGQLTQGGISVSSAKNSVVIESQSEFSKRYLKYLTKKFLKRNSLRDWLRVVATDKDTYELRYFQINQDEEGEGEE